MKAAQTWSKIFPVIVTESYALIYNSRLYKGVEEGQRWRAAIESSCWKHAKLLDFIQQSGEMLEITKLVKQTERKKMRKREGERQREGKGAKIWHFWEFVCSFWTFTNFDFFGRQRRKSLNADVLVKLSVISISPPRLRIRSLLREFLFLGTLQLKIKKKTISLISVSFSMQNTLNSNRERRKGISDF